MSESKFVEDPASFVPHILNPNRKALEDLITKPAVERALLQRLLKKAAVYAQGFAPDGEPKGDTSKIDVDGVVELYEHYIIPLTREVEVRILLHGDHLVIERLLIEISDFQVDYLLERLNGLSPEQIDELASKKKQ